MTTTEIITTRISEYLSNWLKKHAEQKNCSVNDLIKECILAYKQLQEVPDSMRFSNLLEVHGAKAAIMTYRLLEVFIRTTQEQGKEIVVTAANHGLEEISKWKINNGNS
jgi:hypothetical protein